MNRALDHKSVPNVRTTNQHQFLQSTRFAQTCGEPDVNTRNLMAVSFARCGPVHMNIDPVAVLKLPNSGLLRLIRDRLPASANALRQTHVGNTRRVGAQHVHVGGEDGRVCRHVALTKGIIKIELVKFDTLNQVPIRLRLEGGDMRVDQPTVRVKIQGSNACNKSLGQTNNLQLFLGSPLRLRGYTSIGFFHVCGHDVFVRTFLLPGAAEVVSGQQSS